MDDAYRPFVGDVMGDALRQFGDVIEAMGGWVQRPTGVLVRAFGDYVLFVRQLDRDEWHWYAGLAGAGKEPNHGGWANTPDEAKAQAMRWLAGKLARELEYISKELGL